MQNRRLPCLAPLLMVLTVTACASGEAGQRGDAGSLEAQTGVEFPAANRPDVRGTHGAVSSDHPLATAVGYTMLQNGGNAVDAVMAMAGVLAVVRPHMNGVGGDAFAIFYDGETGDVVGMNGSGRAAALATPSFFEEAGHDDIPGSGPLSVSVSGAVAAFLFRTGWRATSTGRREG